MVDVLEEDLEERRRLDEESGNQDQKMVQESLAMANRFHLAIAILSCLFRPLQE